MPAATKTRKPAAATAKSKAVKKAAAPAAPVKQPRKAKQAEPEPTPQEVRSAAISAAMLELSEERKEARATRGGTPAKWLIFDLWLKALQSKKVFDVDATAAKYPEVKASTVKAWVNKFKNGRLPSHAKNKAAEVAKLLKAAK